MNLKFLYMKFLGLLTVTIGFGYCLTSFYNLFDILLGRQIIDENINILIINIGLLFPLFVFIFGIFFYFYSQTYKEKKRVWVLISSSIMGLLGIIKLAIAFNILQNDIISKVFTLVHPSFAYLSFLLSLLYIYGIIKYRY